MWRFVFFSALYPVNLYIFEFLFKPKYPNLKIKVASIIFSCLCLLLSLKGSALLDFTFNWRILKWFCVGIGPFVLPLLMENDGEGFDFGSFLAWRNFVIAPACEELYYRLLLPKLHGGTFLLSLSFSLAHAHPLLFPSNWLEWDVISGQCFTSFLFGIVCNRIRAKMTDGNLINFWVWMALTATHGIANYCGIPLIKSENKFLKMIQLIILIASLILILK